MKTGGTWLAIAARGYLSFRLVRTSARRRITDIAAAAE
jgi:hypothetical protein